MKLKYLLYIASIGLSLFIPVSAGGSVSEIKAELALLRNLSLFTDWPTGDSAFNKSPQFKLCTYKDYAVFREIKRIIESSRPPLTIKKKQVVVDNTDKPDEILKCHAVLLTNVDNNELKSLLARRKPSGPLLFGAEKGLGEAGVHFNIYLKPDNRLGFELNMQAMALTGHSPKYQLLNYAKVLKKERRL